MIGLDCDIDAEYRDITDCDRGFDPRNIGSDNPKMGHWQGFTAVYADEGIYGYPPRPDRMYPIGSYV
eukprot:2488461-Pleurochrysis_carterae.AAC.1